MMLQQEGSVLGQASSWQGAAGPACLFFFFFWMLLEQLECNMGASALPST